LRRMFSESRMREIRPSGLMRGGSWLTHLGPLLPTLPPSARTRYHAPRDNGRIDPPLLEQHPPPMHAIEFTTELSDSRLLPIPPEVADQLPKKGRVRIIVLTDEPSGDAEWRKGAYQQFLRDDSPEDAIYDSCR